MTLQETISLILMGIGVTIALISAIGLQRFDDVLARLHAISKPPVAGLFFSLAGAAVALGSWSAAAMLLVVLLAQMATVPVGSTMIARAVFRRGFVNPEAYAFDELTPRMATSHDDNDDEGDGFVDEFPEAEDPETHARLEALQIPDNVVSDDEFSSDEFADVSSWDEPEVDLPDNTTVGLDIDLEDETEREAGSIAEEDERARLARAEAYAARTASEQRS